MTDSFLTEGQERELAIFDEGTCLGLASASLLLQNGTFSWNQSYAQNAEMTQQHSLGNLTEWNGTEIFQDVIDCTVASCSQNNISTCPEQTRHLDGMLFAVDDIDTVFKSLESFCDEVGLQVNSDIAGPGVMTSYILQISAALLFWLVVKVLTSWPRVFAWPIFLCTREKRPDPGFDPNLSCAPYDEKPGRRKSAWRRANAMQRRLRRLRLHAATVSTLVEFQEVQAFFVGAIQIATLATFKPGGSSQSDAHSITSFGEAILDSQLVQVLAINGILPILLVQYILQTYDKRWWYSFALLWVTFVLALAVQARRNSLISSFDVLWDVLKSESPVDECGGNANPMVYCNTYLSPAESIGGEIFVTYCGMIMLSIDFMIPRLLNWSFLKIIIARVRAMEYEQKSPGVRIVKKICRRTVWFLWSLLEYVLAGTMCYYLMNLLMIAFSMTGGSNTWGSWSFGQLVSVMVWVPLLFKFIYYNVFGIEEGVGSRLTKEFRVVHDEELDTEDSGYANIEIDEFQQLQDPTSSRRDNDRSAESAVSTPGLSHHGSLDSLVANAPRAYHLDHKSSSRYLLGGGN
ncbi:hypothetical protein M406DRAFT_333487 [Cryphonectria parasitica EP155]|uniref:Uncharacterized protein n=1 Tax=Cryphonectria parasitica (strain ATCC 38755 / EP155) TaxID=660469 RepID=A0A9P4XV86_CRYP1|nr:uncharacterized protein M406DRAFT_333487 [Cryphonectria parasitica EP155]KAF3761426.1 hypothetical protein M406DRAFT_333487 [Cryphonectria parasitica EP155]